ncbi:hypothetical protein I4F81_005505 [Pyropia yezoensis]|uniref:Uncharacterized protein n=1 Tax=Pyropia yezoensis TaxID=2788 RepID=A0ACC3BY38_PYRYE|nr:hypothetical protein I4F81_005505 [Neopyropia yezoensis]
MDTLSAMVPSSDPSVLARALDASGGDLAEAVDAVLAASVGAAAPPPPATAAPPPPPPRRAAGVYALGRESDGGEEGLGLGLDGGAAPPPAPAPLSPTLGGGGDADADAADVAARVQQYDADESASNVNFRFVAVWWGGGTEEGAGAVSSAGGGAAVTTMARGVRAAGVCLAPCGSPGACRGEGGVLLRAGGLPADAPAATAAATARRWRVVPYRAEACANVPFSPVPPGGLLLAPIVRPPPTHGSPARTFPPHGWRSHGRPMRGRCGPPLGGAAAAAATAPPPPPCRRRPCCRTWSRSRRRRAVATGAFYRMGCDR